MNPKEIFIKYLNIVLLENKNGEGLSEILTGDFIFHDPFTTGISSAKEFINNPATQNWINTKKSYRIQKQFAEENHACLIYTISVVTPGGQTIDVDLADSIEIRDNKIAKENVYFSNPVAFAKAMGFLEMYMKQYLN